MTNERPMGHQLNYFLMPEDTRLLEERLRERCPVAFLDTRSQQPAAVQLPGLEVAEFGKTRLRVLLAPPEALESVILEYIPQQGYWLVDSSRSPVIEMDRCYYDGSILRKGRLYYQRQFVDKGAWVEKPADFQAWAKRVFTVVRKGLQRDPEVLAYLGPHAQQARQRGLELVDL
jgi:hypothetical protein